MKRYSFVFLIFYACLAMAQKQEINPYSYEEKGYFLNPQAIYNGFIATDNYSNTLYRIKSGTLEKIISAPGCGRYYTISPDKKFIGFKYIKNGQQAPALFNLYNDETILLHEFVDNCGQVSFSTTDIIAYTIGHELHLHSSKNHEIITLEGYSNITPISPDGKYVIYNYEESLYLFDINNKKSRMISPACQLSVYPQWSPNSKKILYQSENMYIYDINTAATFNLGDGLAPKWSPDSKDIIFYKTSVINDIIENSDLFISDYKGENKYQITSTDNILEMQASFIDENTIVYHTYGTKSIEKIVLKGYSIKSKAIIYKHQGDLDIDYFNPLHNKSEVRIPGTIPYVHQVYDTRDDHYGHGSCAPATCIMAFAYFNRLPKWPVSCSSPYSHISNYGNYISQKYTLNEYYYDDMAETSGGDDAYGGYGYMWGLGSPNSKMKDYVAAHYFTSVQYWTSGCTFAKTKTEIDANYPHPMCVMLTSSGHLILCKGYVVGQYTLIFSDPYGNKNTPGYPSYDGQDAYYDWPGYNYGFQNLDYNGSYGYVAWTVTSQGTETTYNDTIIDDIYYNHGFNMNNSQNTSHMRYFHDANAGYNSHLWFTYTMANLSDICWVTWEPSLPQSGKYEVFAYIPSVNADADGARYIITHAGGDTTVVINQANFNDEWVSLGTYEFDTSLVSSVYLGDSTGVTGQSIAFDAIKWSYKPVPLVDFTANNVICSGDTVFFTNNTVDGNNYLWAFPGGTPSSSTVNEPFVVYNTPGFYDVKLIAYNIGGTDSLELTAYIQVNPLPQASFAVNDTLFSLPQATVIFMNNSTNADNYFWDFGNGINSTDSNPYCIYNSEGIYTITLIAYSHQCSADTIVMFDFIHVLNNASVNNLADNFNKIYPNPFKDQLIIEMTDISSINIYDAVSKLVYHNSSISDKEIINTAAFNTGLYFISIILDDGYCITLKAFKE